MKKAGEILFKLYFGLGVVAIAILACIVMFTVIMRYCFSMNWKEVAEFNVTLFTFTTFWGMGVNVLMEEHVRIDILYNLFPPVVKKYLSIVDYLVVLIVDLIFTKMGFDYVAMAGKQISMGMEIPMKYMYGIMPVSGVICAVCVVIKLIELAMRPTASFADDKKEARSSSISKNKAE